MSCHVYVDVDVNVYDWLCDSVILWLDTALVIPSPSP